MMRITAGITSLLFVVVPLAAQLPSAPATTESPSAPVTFSVPALVPQQFTGSVPTGSPSAQPLSLSLKDALDLGLKNNLGLLLSGREAAAVRAQRMRALSELLPNVSGKITESEQQINLAAFGITPPAGTPNVVGPFPLSDARLLASAPILDLKLLNNRSAASHAADAAQFSTQDAREIVVLVVANSYLLALARAAQVEAADAQLQTAQSLYDQAVHMRNAGMVAGIDVLRANVQLQTRKQQLSIARNGLEKQKLDLARTIGLPPGQALTLTTPMPVAPAVNLTLEQAIAGAMADRRDLKRATALVASAEATRRASFAEALPSLRFDGDYGDIGPHFSSSHSTFTASASLKVPLFQGGKVRADVAQADAVLAQRKAELADLRAGIEAEVRRAFLDLQSAAEQVDVSRQAVQLATDALQQARDRYQNGVADNIEVVQAQEALVNAHENYIASIYADAIAKATLARAIGQAEALVKQFLGEK